MPQSNASFHRGDVASLQRYSSSYRTGRSVLSITGWQCRHRDDDDDEAGSAVIALASTQLQFTADAQ
jgi:hypothetical protein